MAISAVRAASGKTTILEKIISRFTDQGISVGILKNSHHALSFDTPGKDSYRFRKAGATAVVVATPSTLVSVRTIESNLSPEAFMPYFEGVNILFSEGFKNASFPKIEVWRKENTPAPIATNDPNLIALITDDPISISEPVFSFSQLEEILIFIQQRFLPKGPIS